MAWSNSLFEDNAELGLGMAASMNTRPREMKSAVKRLAEKVNSVMSQWNGSMEWKIAVVNAAK